MRAHGTLFSQRVLTSLQWRSLQIVQNQKAVDLQWCGLQSPKRREVRPFILHYFIHVLTMPCSISTRTSSDLVVSAPEEIVARMLFDFERSLWPIMSWAVAVSPFRCRSRYHFSTISRWFGTNWRSAAFSFFSLVLSDFFFHFIAFRFYDNVNVVYSSWSSGAHWRNCTCCSSNRNNILI